jgi:hypothetical protein
MKIIVTIAVVFSMFFTQKTYAQNKLNQDSIASCIAENQQRIDSIQKIIDYQKIFLTSFQPAHPLTKEEQDKIYQQIKWFEVSAKNEEEYKKIIRKKRFEYIQKFFK